VREKRQGRAFQPSVTGRRFFVFSDWPLVIGYWLKTDFVVMMVLRHPYRLLLIQVFG
jgi:hypothetical protein